MRIDHSLERNFPNLAEWIKAEIPTCINDSMIWNAFLKYSQLKASDARLALMDNGLAPTIDIATISLSTDGKYRPRFKRNSHKIFISRSSVGNLRSWAGISAL